MFENSETRRFVLCPFKKRLSVCASRSFSSVFVGEAGPILFAPQQAFKIGCL